MTMDPESLKNIPSYLVLAYTIQWDDSVDDNIVETFKLPRYVLLDLRAYQRPEQLGEDGLNEVVCNRLSEMHGFCVQDVKIKVIEA
jgi:hypothetical protein